MGIAPVGTTSWGVGTARMDAPGVGWSVGWSVGVAAAQVVDHCTVTLHADGMANVGALSIKVEHAVEAGAFLGEDEAPPCRPLETGVFADVAPDAGSGRIDLAMLAVSGVELPLDLWVCDFQSSGERPMAEDFTVTVTDARDTLSNPVEVTASVSSIVCDEDAVCGDATVAGMEECDFGATNEACTEQCLLAPGARRCVLDVTASAVASGGEEPGGGEELDVAAELGGLQLELPYDAAGVLFEGAGADVSCRAMVNGGFSLTEDVDDEQRLLFGWISASPLTLPALLWECDLVTIPGAVDTQQLVATDVAAVDPLAEAIDVEVDMAVRCVGGPECGDGQLEAPETCDDGDTAWSAGQYCNAECGELACGDPDDSGMTSATDALFTLRTSVGLSACDVCICDIDGSGQVQATDALRLLLWAVGSGPGLACQGCEG